MMQRSNNGKSSAIDIENIIILRGTFMLYIKHEEFYLHVLSSLFYPLYR